MGNLEHSGLVVGIFSASEAPEGIVQQQGSSSGQRNSRRGGDSCGFTDV